jgi:hypothetical protein
MRTHIRAIALLTAVVGVTSCSKDFLTEVPVDFVAPKTSIAQDDAVAAVNAATRLLSTCRIRWGMLTTWPQPVQCSSMYQPKW